MPLKIPVQIQQQTIGYCLPACVQMALNQLGLMNLNQTKLAKILGTNPNFGTPFSRLNRLNQINVQFSTWGGWENVVTALTNENAVILALLDGMPGWGSLQTQHAILVFRTEMQQVIYYDPALAYGPVQASLDTILLAWSDMDEDSGDN